MMGDGESRLLRYPPVYALVYRLIYIKHPAAPFASEMRMNLFFCLEPAYRTPDIKLGNLSGFQQDFEIPVHRPFAYVGNLFFDHFIYRVSRRMGVGATQ